MAQADSNELARTEAIDFARRLVQHWQEALGAELLGAYLIGSLAHAGFNRRYSDIDLAIVTEAGLLQDALDSLMSVAVALSSDWGSKVSIFWSDRHFSLGRFPLLDRVDFLDHAVALMEREHSRPPRPTLDEIRQYLRACAEFCCCRKPRAEGSQDVLTDDTLPRALLLQLDDRLHWFERRRCDVSERKTLARAQY